MSKHDTIDLRFTEAFSLAASVSLAARAAFLREMRGGEEAGEPAVLDLAFALEGSWKTIGVTVAQRGDRVRVRVIGNPEGAAADDVRAHLEHMLSLDVGGAGFAAVAARDDVVARLQWQRPGVRPVLFPSPYEAAARAIIGHNLHVRQAAAIQARIATEHGVAFDLGGRVLHGFPAPSRLAALSAVQGLVGRKIEQLRALGAAAAEGWLDSARLRVMDSDAALSHLQQLAGIGTFSAELILLRGLGDPDAFPRTEMRLHRAMAAAYQLGDAPELESLERIADRWRPYRSWVGLLLRNAT